MLGTVFGKTDKQAAYPLEFPVSPGDVVATIPGQMPGGGAIGRFDYFSEFAYLTTDNALPNNGFENRTYAGRFGVQAGRRAFGHEPAIGGMKLDLVDAIAEPVVGFQPRRVLVRLESPADRASRTGERADLLVQFIIDAVSVGGLYALLGAIQIAEVFCCCGFPGGAEGTEGVIHLGRIIAGARRFLDQDHGGGRCERRGAKRQGAEHYYPPFDPA